MSRAFEDRLAERVGTTGVEDREAFFDFAFTGTSSSSCSGRDNLLNQDSLPDIQELRREVELARVGCLASCRLMSIGASLSMAAEMGTLGSSNASRVFVVEDNEVLRPEP